MRNSENIYSHTFENYNKRLNDQPKTFFSKNDTISSEVTNEDWSRNDQTLRNRKIRKKFSID